MNSALWEIAAGYVDIFRSFHPEPGCYTWWTHRNQARQLVRHRHIEVNGRIVNVPSFRVSAGDEIAVKAKSKDLALVQGSLESRTRPALVDWIALDEKNRVGRVTRVPTRQEIPMAVQEQLIVELYSK